MALALRTGSEPLAAAELSKANHIPHRYLEQILNSLRRKGLVDSTRGTKGGYRLARDPSHIRVGDIIRAVEGELEPILCSVPEHRSQDCRTNSGCHSRGLCHSLERALMSVLDGTTLEDMKQEALQLRHSHETARLGVWETEIINETSIRLAEPVGNIRTEV
jgi:Rrf2 family cysteine metabolism transcriptional repressor